MTHDVVLPVNFTFAIISFGLGLLVCAVLVFFLRQLDLFPSRPSRFDHPDNISLTRGLFFNGMQDAVLIVDHRGRLIEFNPAAKGLLHNLTHADLGRPAAEVFASQPMLVESLVAAVPCEMVLREDNAVQHFDMRTVPLFSGSRRLGYAAVFTNNTAQAHVREQLRIHAETDTLTGIANRRCFQQALQRECTRYNRYRKSFSLMLIDIDRFKYVNDRYGHPAGDAVLRAIVQRLQPCLREHDLLSRHGGEEFSVLLLQTGREAALVAAERVRNAVAAEPFLIEGVSIDLTISIGLITQAGEWAKDSYLIKQADIALYQAKSHGRNCVIAAQVANLSCPPPGGSGARIVPLSPSRIRQTASSSGSRASLLSEVVRA